MTLRSEETIHPATDALIMRLSSVVDHTEAEGPGLRFALWTQGCNLACPGCCNPHLWTSKAGDVWTVQRVFERVLAARVRRPELEGISLIGGEPFEQDAPLAALALRCRDAGLSVMAYSGFTKDELHRRGSTLLEACDLLVDGPYIQALRTTKRRFIGSTNQGLHFLSDRYTANDPRFSQPNHAEIRFNDRGEVQVVGFPFDRVRAAFGPGSGRPRQPSAGQANA